MKENNQPLISICIPTYNRAKMLEESLNKILYQLTTSELLDFVEVIISDNDSKDNTKELVTKLDKEYNNIRYYRNNHNIWWLANIMKVAEYANWKYIWLLSDDDCVTDFSLWYVLEIINKENFDVMFCNSVSSENMNIGIEKGKNTYHVFDGISKYLNYLKNNYKWYKNLISFFSFYSILIIKTEYFRTGVLNFQSNINWNDFPHDIVTYHNLVNKKIIIPNNVFVIWRLLNEWYVWSEKLIKSFEECMNFIERENKLKDNSNWQVIKKICVKWRTKNITLWWVIAKLHINYKTNWFLKKIYYLYKRWIQ